MVKGIYIYIYIYTVTLINKNIYPDVNELSIARSTSEKVVRPYHHSVLDCSVHCTFIPLLLLMTHHEETRLIANRSPNPNPRGGTKVE